MMEDINKMLWSIAVIMMCLSGFSIRITDCFNLEWVGLLDIIIKNIK